MLIMLKNICKWTFISGSGIALSAITTIGAVGTHYKQNAVNFYTSTRDAVMNASNGGINRINSIRNELKKYNTSPEICKNQILYFLDETKNSLSNSIVMSEHINHFHNPLFENSFGVDTTKKDLINHLSNSLNEINNIYNQVKELPIDSNSINNEIINNIDNNLSNLTVNNFTNINKVLTEVTPEVFSHFYGVTANILTGIGAVILGSGVLFGIVSFTFYKPVDGKMVSRKRFEKELASHVSYILKNYPEIKEDIR